MILRKLIALIMALVIANPACCCAFTSSHKNSEQPLKSCCSNNSKDDSNQDHKSCNCSIDKQQSSLETDFNLPAPVSADFQYSESPSADLFLPALPEAVAFLKKRPPGDLPVPTVGSRLAAKCSYLI